LAKLLSSLKQKIMSEPKKTKSADQQSRESEETKINEKVGSRNMAEESDIEQTRIEYRREADLEDKTPAGDSGPEDADTNDINMEGSTGY
jgi:hypothetical protein